MLEEVSVDALNQSAPAEEQEIDEYDSSLEREVRCCECIQLVLGIVFYATFFGIIFNFIGYLDYFILKSHHY